MSSQRIVLLECYAGHGECLEFQLNALRRTGLEIELWTHPAHAGLRTFCPGIRHITLQRPIMLSAARRLWLSPPSLLIVNTTTGPTVRNLLWLIRPLRLVTVGVFHDVDKLRSPSARMMAKMIDARLMLAKHLSKAAEEEVGVPFDYAHFLSSCGRAVPDSKEVLIVVPGAFSPDKKDITTLFDLARDHRLNPKVKFVLLGRFSADPETARWWNRCVEHGVEHRFIRFTDFVPQSLFDSYLTRGHAILPLIQPGCEHYARFRNDKVSGAVNLALGLGLPLLIHADLAKQWRFGPAVMAYDGTDELLGLINSGIERASLSERAGAIVQAKESNIVYQQMLYLNACIRAARHASGDRAHSHLKPKNKEGAIP